MHWELEKLRARLNQNQQEKRQVKMQRRYGNVERLIVVHGAIEAAGPQGITPSDISRQTGLSTQNIDSVATLLSNSGDSVTAFSGTQSLEARYAARWQPVGVSSVISAIRAVLRL